MRCPPFYGPSRHSVSGRARPTRALLIGAALVLALPSSPAAHEVPANVAVQAYVKPEQDRLRVLVRIPLVSVRDIDFPLRGPGYLDLAQAPPLLLEAAKLWIADYMVFFEDGTRLPEEDVVAARVSLPSDRSFASYDAALASILGPPLPVETEVPWQQALMDVLLEVPITAADARFSVDPGLAHLGQETMSVVHFLPPGGGERVFQYVGNPGLVRLDPRWHQAAWRFVVLGFEHIMDGIDHLLFIFCLVIPFRRLRPLVVIVTAFTVAHSITLIASALGLAPDALWFPPLVETLIALSIVWMAFENIVGARLERRWIVAFAFGLVHGFGFSFFLRESLQFAGSHLLTSLVAFNVGVELGQLLVVAIAVPVLNLAFRRVVPERIGTVILSALVAHTAWHWMTERWGDLRQFEFGRPVFDAALAAAAMRWLMLALILGGSVWVMWIAFGRAAQRWAGDERNAAAPADGPLDAQPTRSPT